MQKVPQRPKTREDRGPWWRPVWDALNGFIDDDALTYAAAIAFYTALAFAPLIIILVACLSLFVGDAAQAELIDQIRAVVGPSAAKIAEGVLASGSAEPEISSWAGVAGVIALLVSATGVFAQLQGSLNAIWGVAPAPRNSLLEWLRKRLWSLGMIIALGFLLLVSLVFSAAVQFAFNATGLDPERGWLWLAVDNLVSIAVFFAIFCGIFRYLPDVTIRWSNVWRGGLVTALLFAFGKWAIGKYLGVSSIGSAYGAAGSLVLLLVWVYYSSIIVLFGAELTEAWTLWRGYAVRPEEIAEIAPHEAQRGQNADLIEIDGALIDPEVPPPDDVDEDEEADDIVR